MKKFTKVAAILAASAILFGGMFMSCSDSDDSNDGTPSTPVSDKAPAPAVTFTSATETVAKAALGEATAATVASSDNTVATATVSEGTVTIVSVNAGSATITATAEGYNDASIPVTVAANGAITLGTITKFSVKSGEPVTPPTTETALWDFTTQPTNVSTTESALENVTIVATSGTIASVVANGNKFKWNSDSDGGYIQTGASSNVTVDDAASCKTNFAVTTTVKSTIEVLCRGAGGADNKRYVAILDAKKTKLVGEGNLGSNKVTLTTKSLDAGIYTIAANGSRIFSITVKAAE